MTLTTRQQKWLVRHSETLFGHFLGRIFVENSTPKVRKLRQDQIFRSAASNMVLVGRFGVKTWTKKKNLLLARYSETLSGRFREGVVVENNNPIVRKLRQDKIFRISASNMVSVGRFDAKTRKTYKMSSIFGNALRSLSGACSGR